MKQNIKIQEIQSKSALSKCGFSEGSFCINPYLGCGHGCLYCYARFMKRFTGHQEKWGTFVDVRTNIAEVLKKQLRSPKFKNTKIYIGTVTDPYQPLEAKYKLSRKILEVLLNYQQNSPFNFSNRITILTKSDLILRDLDILKQFKELEIDFTINTLDEKWKSLVEPKSSSIKQRLQAIKRLTAEGLTVGAMMGPYWPIFTEPEALFREFKNVGLSHIFTESFNTSGGNWTDVGEVLKKYYPQFLTKIKNIFFDKRNFYEFYNRAESKVKKLSQIYKIPVTIYF